MEYKKLVAELRERGLSNGSTIGHHSGLYEVAAYAIEELLARAEKAERERDVAIKWLKVAADENGECYGCKWLDESTEACKNSKGKLECDNRENNMWEWRGLEE